MTRKNIAELAGVSVSTVSKAFSGSSEISEETKQRIFDLAKEHNCFDRYSKQRFEKKVIAVIVPEDFSVVGINDIGIIPYLDVPLSTIRTYSDKACEFAVELLMKKLKNQYFMLREKVTVSSDFVIRKSTGPNKNA